MKPGDLVKTCVWDVDERGTKRPHTTFLWDSISQDKRTGRLVGSLPGDVVGLVLATEREIGDEEVLLLARGIYGWVWMGELEVVK